MKYACELCDHIYEVDNNTKICPEDFIDNWTCPICGLSGFVLYVVS